MDGHDERRRFLRHELDAAERTASVLVLRLGVRVSAQATQVGMGGVKLECELLPEAVNKDDRVVVRLGGPTLRQPVTLPGHIAWSRNHRGGLEMGIEFEGDQPEIRTVLAPYLRQIEQRRAALTDRENALAGPGVGQTPTKVE